MRVESLVTVSTPTRPGRSRSRCLRLRIGCDNDVARLDSQWTTRGRGRRRWPDDLLRIREHRRRLAAPPSHASSVMPSTNSITSAGGELSSTSCTRAMLGWSSASRGRVPRHELRLASALLSPRSLSLLTATGRSRRRSCARSTIAHAATAEGPFNPVPARQHLRRRHRATDDGRLQCCESPVVGCQQQGEVVTDRVVTAGQERRAFVWPHRQKLIEQSLEGGPAFRRHVHRHVACALVSLLLMPLRVCRRVTASGGSNPGRNA